MPSENNPTTDTPSPGLTRRDTTVMVAASAVVALIVAAVIVVTVGFVRRSSNSPGAPDAIERAQPSPNGAMLRQDQVGVDLRDGWYCSLSIDGTIIPDDQLTGVKTRGECFFRPGAGKEVEELAPGTHTAVATIRRLDQPDLVERYQWSFDVH